MPVLLASSKTSVTELELVHMQMPLLVNCCLRVYSLASGQLAECDNMHNIKLLYSPKHVSSIPATIQCGPWPELTAVLC